MFFIAGRKILGDGDAFCIGDVFQHLFSERANTKGCQSAAQVLIAFSFAPYLDELVTKGGGIPKNMFIDDANQSIQLHQGVLEWCCCQE